LRDHETSVYVADCVAFNSYSRVTGPSLSPPRAAKQYRLTNYLLTMNPRSSGASYSTVNRPPQSSPARPLAGQKRQPTHSAGRTSSPKRFFLAAGERRASLDYYYVVQPAPWLDRSAWRLIWRMDLSHQTAFFSLLASEGPRSPTMRAPPSNGPSCSFLACARPQNCFCPRFFRPVFPRIRNLQDRAAGPRPG